MRVLHLTRDLAPRTTGGISTAVAGLVGASTRAGLGCAVLSFDGWRPRAGPRGGPLPVPTSGPHGATLRLSNPDQRGVIDGFVDQARPDVLHVHHEMLWPIAARLRQRCGVPALLTTHVLQAEQNRLRGLTEATLSSTAQARALAEADAILAPSQAALACLQAEVPERRDQLWLAPLGVDDSAEARASVGAERDRGPVLYAGRFSDLNGTGELFAALPHIAARAPERRFVIAGGVPENRKGERRWRARWQRQLDAQPTGDALSGAGDSGDSDGCAALRDRVELPGWLDAAALRAQYRRAAVLVIPSWFETFGLVALEGMLHGVPIVAARAGALAERISHQHTGLLYPPRDLDQLVEAVVALLRDPARAAQLGRNAAAAARSGSRWEDVIEAHLHVYRQVA
ncbi:MAG: glycosyltransferase family 1 protein [Haliangiales bacterium]